MSFYALFADHYEKIFPFRPATLDFLRRRLPERGRVLDLGCGAGHYTAALAESGLDAIGLDLDPAMIGAARRRGGGARFVTADLAEARSISPRADGAFCVGNTLPHLPPGKLTSFLADLARMLPAGAPWIVQTVNFDRLLPLVESHDLPAIEAGGLVFRRRYEPGTGGRLRFVTALERDREVVFAGEETLWPLASGDLAAVHAAAGFEMAAAHGGLSGDPFIATRSEACVQVYRRRNGS